MIVLFFLRRRFWAMVVFLVGALVSLVGFIGLLTLPFAPWNPESSFWIRAVIWLAVAAVFLGAMILLDFAVYLWKRRK